MQRLVSSREILVKRATHCMSSNAAHRPLQQLRHWRRGQLATVEGILRKRDLRGERVIKQRATAAVAAGGPAVTIALMRQRSMLHGLWETRSSM